MAKARLIVIEDGYQRWRIFGPVSTFGEEIYILGGREERRYEQICVVEGNFDEALDVLVDLEGGRRDGEVSAPASA